MRRLREEVSCTYRGKGGGEGMRLCNFVSVSGKWSKGTKGEGKDFAFF